MAEYRVLWEIDLEADTPEQAAEMAREIQARDGSTATVFTVMGRATSSGGIGDGPIFERVGEFDVRDGKALTIDAADALDAADNEGTG